MINSNFWRTCFSVDRNLILEIKQSYQIRSSFKQPQSCKSEHVSISSQPIFSILSVSAQLTYNKCQITLEGAKNVHNLNPSKAERIFALYRLP